MIISVTDPTIKRAVIELQLKRKINLSNPAFLEAFKKEYQTKNVQHSFTKIRK